MFDLCIGRKEFVFHSAQGKSGMNEINEMEKVKQKNSHELFWMLNKVGGVFVVEFFDSSVKRKPFVAQNDLGTQEGRIFNVKTFLEDLADGKYFQYGKVAHFVLCFSPLQTISIQILHRIYELHQSLTRRNSFDFHFEIFIVYQRFHNEPCGLSWKYL